MTLLCFDITKYHMDKAGPKNVGSTSPTDPTQNNITEMGLLFVTIVYKSNSKNIEFNLSFSFF